MKYAKNFLWMTALGVSIGAGHVGGVLAGHLAALGHQVVIANSRGPESLAALATNIGAKAVSVNETPRGQDMVIVAITEKAIASLPTDLFDGVPANVVVVDACNYYPDRDGLLAEIEGV